MESVNGTVDIDHQHPDFIANRHGRYGELRAQCPVVYNTAYGGFWLVTDYESVAAVARDNETFAHRFAPNADDGISYQGILNSKYSFLTNTLMWVSPNSMPLRLQAV